MRSEGKIRNNSHKIMKWKNVKIMTMLGDEKGEGVCCDDNIKMMTRKRLKPDRISLSLTEVKFSHSACFSL
jgi:hypothetical protein